MLGVVTTDEYYRNLGDCPAGQQATLLSEGKEILYKASCVTRILVEGHGHG